MQCEKISTHTPAWGATQHKKLLKFSVQISTHTPAWGATCAGFELVPPHIHFNSHARVGRDLQDIVTENGKIISTHTPAWGATV